MKKLNLLWVFILLISVVVVAPASVRADSNEIAEFNTLQQAKEWLGARGLSVNGVLQDNFQAQVMVAEVSCMHTPIVTDPALSGPLGTNTQVAAVNKAFCETPGSQKFNKALVDVGSRWPGNPAKPDQIHRVWGLLAVRDANTLTLNKAFAFDIQGDPSDTIAVQQQLEWQGPYVQKQWRFDVEINATALPENTGPATYLASWFFNTQPLNLYLPVINNGGSQSCPFKLHIKSANAGDTDEVYCFIPQGISQAELHFSFGETVYSWWEDANGNKLSAFPGTEIIYRLDSPHSYKDYPTPSNTMKADKYYPDGEAPWLATHHELSGQFKLGGITYRVTVPMIWDP